MTAAPLAVLLGEIQKQAMEHNSVYLCQSTALGELGVWH
jgi:hypothetical protein